MWDSVGHPAKTKLATAMASVHWIIQENQGDSNSVQRMVEALESDGHIPHLVWLTKSPDVPAIPDLPDDARIVCHGQGLLTRAFHHVRLKSGLFFDPDKFRWSAFRSGWEQAMLSFDGRVMTLSDAGEFLRQEESAFVRPDSDSKVFDGAIYDAAGFAAIIHKTQIPPTTQVVVASPCKIEAEWRFFVVDHQIVGCSEYRRWGRSSTDGSVPRLAIELAAELASRWSPSDVYCLDLASTGDRIGVVEANCFNASRFYATVIERVLRSVNTFVLSRDQSRDQQ
jgi:ATP-grasp domain, R2K clade family 3